LSDWSLLAVGVCFPVRYGRCSRSCWLVAVWFYPSALSCFASRVPRFAFRVSRFAFCVPRFAFCVSRFAFRSVSVLSRFVVGLPVFVLL
jgi:hypothetical protein